MDTAVVMKSEGSQWRGKDWARGDGSGGRPPMAAPENEIDEEEQMDAAFVMESEDWPWRRKDWVRQFREGSRMQLPTANSGSTSTKRSPQRVCSP